MTDISSATHLYITINVAKKMKFIYFLLFASFLYSKNVYATENVVEDSILWKLTKGNEVINILGVTHIGFEKQYPVDKTILSALNSSEIILIESNVIIESNQQIKERLQKAYKAEGSSTTLDALLKSSYCEKIGKDRKTLENISVFLGNDLLLGLLKLSPRALAHQLYSHHSPLTELEVKDLKVTESLERNLITRAVQSGKKIMSLDPEFWDSIDALNEVEKCDLLVGMVSVFSSEQYKKRSAYESLKKLKALWSEGNSTEMRRQEFLWFDENTPLFSKKISHWFAIRNQMMTEKILIASSSGQKKLFIVLGAAHLAGEDGIIARLKQTGFNPQPILVRG